MKKKKKKKSSRCGRILLIVFLTLLGGCSLFVGMNWSFLFPDAKVIYPDIAKPVVEESNLSLVMVGDALIHSAVYADAKSGSTYDFKPMFTEVKATIQKYDLAFYNQETILGGTEIGLSTYPRFNSPYEVGDAFIDMGFNLVSLATNHTLDRGFTAISNSRAYWNEKTDVIAAGSYSTQEEKDAVVVKEKNGIKYGLLAYTTLTNGLVRPSGKEYALNVYDDQLVKEDIEKLRDKVDLLIVSMHWGIEYSHGISEEQKEIAQYLADLGVDIVVGHHPHVVEPIEFIDDTLVIYSLGNFISSQIGIERLTGLMVGVDITKTTVDGQVNMEIDIPEAELLYTCKASSCGHYKVYPYSKLTSNILPGYQTYYDKYMAIVKKNLEGIERLSAA